MQKKTFIGIALFALAGVLPVGINAATQQDAAADAVPVQVEETNVTVVEIAQPAADAPATTAEMKEQTRKAIQQEKARNAQENDSAGGAITIIAMLIVISALAILSVLFFCFGKVSTYMQRSRKHKAHGVTREDAKDHHDELDSGEAIAAIAMALAEHMGQGHDIEDTILTIRRMRKAYSPWNSKIYNLRVVPEHSEARHMRSLKKQ